jgi:hypothetical protein
MTKVAKKSKVIKINKTILDKFNPIIKTDKEGRKQYDFWKVVNYDADNKQITVLDYAFNDTLHSKPFNGCTGSKFDVISKAEYLERIEDENIIDYLVHGGFEMTEEQKRRGFEGIVEDMSEDEKSELMFDNSYSHLHDYLREELKLTEDEAYTFSCSSGGRCFDKGFKGNINPELSEVINQFEG